MLSAADRLRELEGWLGKQVGDALSASLEIETPAGSSAAWSTICSQFSVTETDAESRVREAAATGMLRGAPVDELYAVLSAIASEGERRLEAIDYGDDGPQQRRWERLRSLLGRIRDETIKAYRKRVFPKKKSMFGAAMASATGKKASSDERNTDAFVMRCQNCGAPRLSQADFNCEYCDTPYAG